MVTQKGRTPEEHREYMRRWYLEHPGKNSENVRRWRLKNPGYWRRNPEARRAEKQRWYARHKDEILAQKARYREANREKLRVDAKAYYQANREKQLANIRAYTEAHREESRARTLAWRKQHPERSRALDAVKKHRYRALIRQNGGSFTSREWLLLKRFFGNRCVRCGEAEKDLRKLGRALAVDHVLPIAKSGRNDIRNIQPLCHGLGGCNNAKAAKCIDYRI